MVMSEHITMALITGGWTIKSDNPSYEPMKVDDKAIEIIARVIAAIKEVK